MKKASNGHEDTDFALAALMEIPQQFQAIKKLKLM
jgi:hypothetical protein